MNFFVLEDTKKLVKYVLYAKHRKANEKSDKLIEVIDPELF